MKVRGSMLLATLLALSGCSPAAAPSSVVVAPEQAQPFAAAVTTRNWIDTTRPTPANGSAPARPSRTLTTEIWYPTTTPGSLGPARNAPLASGGPYPRCRTTILSTSRSPASPTCGSSATPAARTSPAGTHRRRPEQPPDLHSAMTDLRFVEANQSCFALIEEGAGPLVLLLHDFPDTACSWTAARAALARAGFRAVSPFLRGYFPTGIPADRRYDIETLAATSLL